MNFKTRPSSMKDKRRVDRPKREKGGQYMVAVRISDEHTMDRLVEISKETGLSFGRICGNIVEQFAHDDF